MLFACRPAVVVVAIVGIWFEQLMRLLHITTVEVSRIGRTILEFVGRNVD